MALSKSRTLSIMTFMVQMVDMVELRDLPRLTPFMKASYMYTSSQDLEVTIESLALIILAMQ